MLVGAHSTAPATPAVSKASAGALEGWLASGRLLASGSLSDTLHHAAGNGWQIVGAAVGAGAVDVADAGAHLHPAPTVLVLGSEGSGLSESALAACCCLVQVTPRCQPGDALYALDSLNVSAAGAVLMSGVSNAVR